MNNTYRNDQESTRWESTPTNASNFPDILEKFFDDNLVSTDADLINDPFLNFNRVDSTIVDSKNSFGNGYDINEHQNAALHINNHVESIQPQHQIISNPPKDSFSWQSDVGAESSAYQHPVDHSLPGFEFNVLQGNSSLDSFHNRTTFDPWDTKYSTQMQSWNITPGFSDLQGHKPFVPQLPTNDFQYPDPSNTIRLNGPYYAAPIQHNTSHFQIDPRMQSSPMTVPQQLGGLNTSNSLRGTHSDGFFIPTVQTNSNFAEINSELAKDRSLLKKRKAHSTGREPTYLSDSSDRNSIGSADSSLGTPIDVAALRAGERPQKCSEKSWVRINTTTKGETTRTARINLFNEGGSKYKTKNLLNVNWQSMNFNFEYNRHNGMDEFGKSSMSVDQIHEYITQYPGQNLRIWIQVTPGDSARRYASKSHSECIFEGCPNRVWAYKGTIEVGNYRVAFDEKYKLHGKDVVDPFDCVGYAHLYCMERFLDFASICANADVKVDTRGDMKKEPKGEGSFIFGKKHIPERKLAEKFIKAAQLGQLHRTPEFANYPVHSHYRKGEPKPHQQTLTYSMFQSNWDNRARSQLRQFVSRALKPTSCGIHCGDQEIIVVEKKIQRHKDFKKAKKSKTHKDLDLSPFYDYFHPEINIRMAQCKALRERFEQEDGARVSHRPKSSRKRNFARTEDSDENKTESFHGDNDEDDFGGNSNGFENHRQVAMPQRFSPRKRQRVNYNESQYLAEFEPDDYNPNLGFSPVDHFPQTQNWSLTAGSSQFNGANDNLIFPNSGQESYLTSFEAAGNMYSLTDEPADLESLGSVGGLTGAEFARLLTLENQQMEATMSKTSMMKSPPEDQFANNDNNASRPGGFIGPKETRRSERLASKTGTL